MHSRTSSSQSKPGVWKSARDPKSDRIYYYNIATNETTWTKPFDLCTALEKEEMTRKRNETLEFFRDMEANIKKRIREAREKEEAEVYRTRSESKLSGSYESRCPISELDSSSEYSRPRLGSTSGATRRIRTISSIDDDLLEILKFDERLRATGIPNRPRTISGDLSHFSLKPGQKSDSCTPPVEYKLYEDDAKSTSRGDITFKQISPQEKGLFSVHSFNLGSTDSKGVLSEEYFSSYPKDHDLLANVAFSSPNVIVNRKRRNSTGTIYIENTMSMQDNMSTIHCVCVVIRAHMIEAVRSANEMVPDSKEFDIFLDNVQGKYPLTYVPSLVEIKDFFTDVFSKSQLEGECIIMALIYCERLVKKTKGRLSIRNYNWKSIVFACLVMASKVWDDLSMWNVDFSQICGSFTLKRINALELAMLNALEYVIRVPASEYAKYYFHLRSMMARMEHKENLQVNYIAPLNISGARKLQLATEEYQQGQCMRVGRSKSIHYAPNENIQKDHCPLVGIEQIVHTEHMDADGLAHISLSSKSNKKASLTGRSNGSNNDNNSGGNNNGNGLYSTTSGSLAETHYSFQDYKAGHK